VDIPPSIFCPCKT